MKRDDDINAELLANGIEAVRARDAKATLIKPKIVAGRDVVVGVVREHRPPPLKSVDMSNWDMSRIPQREWAIRDCVPLRQVGMFSGEGGTGKSIIELQKNVAHVIGRGLARHDAGTRPRDLFRSRG